MGFEQLAALKAQLMEDAKGNQNASHPKSPPVDAKRDVQRIPAPPRKSDAAARALAALQRRFPRAFPPSSAPKIPLKVGILKDVLAQAASLGLSERDIRNAVKLWCRGQRYWTCLVEGRDRVDLNGAISGMVTATEAEYGIHQENTRLARRQEQGARNRRR